MKKLSLEEMGNKTGGSWGCAMNVGLSILGGVAVIATPGLGAVLGGFAYVVQLKDTAESCFS